MGYVLLQCVGHTEWVQNDVLYARGVQNYAYAEYVGYVEYVEY